MMIDNNEWMMNKLAIVKDGENSELILNKHKELDFDEAASVDINEYNGHIRLIRQNCNAERLRGRVLEEPVVELHAEILNSSVVCRLLNPKERLMHAI